MQITIEKEFAKYRDELRELGFRCNSDRAQIDIKNAADIAFYVRKITAMDSINRIYIEGLS